MAWSSRSDDPIELPTGGRLVTLRDAAHHITALPKRVDASEPWRIATKQLIDARRGPQFHHACANRRAAGTEPWQAASGDHTAARPSAIGLRVVTRVS